MDTLSKARLDGTALAMMSNTYFFELRNPIHPSLKFIGNGRVKAIIINEDSSPELLIQPEDGTLPEYHPIDELSFSPALSVAS